MNTEERLLNQLNKPVKDCSDQEIYDVLLTIVQDMAKEREYEEGKKKVYYISAEFLIGKLLSNNLINLGIYDDVADGSRLC